MQESLASREWEVLIDPIILSPNSLKFESQIRKAPLVIFKIILKLKIDSSKCTTWSLLAALASLLLLIC